ncbi:uncharacterized protein B0I36DRAFT_363463 [Microdochium trichocladiopsis]|uniref:DUF6594 domain-containing protein n=1 Tax=Microdochium trichocladiopsis TaxID=1682393 RepID=A0A9P9BP37_9PEZI|nr:uncharacterized protein B0I36DRAFT_363463 [Microdochium trichocladiopsis]KAH7028842.1 hypothetical protein B0I36DRAFT_363463 [Microdochium trichocladiopsis]
MPFQQHSPAQSIVGYPSSFIHLNDHRHAIEPISPPPTGYSLLASKLAARFPDGQGLPIQPLYRRFGKLTHRMLLHLQDEICQLEDQLHGVDDAGAHNRQMYPGHISPESRRAEESANGELYQHKTHLLGQIGFKLELYNNLLKSFHTTQDMPSASVDDVHDYRTFLNDETPIDELETRFLDHVDDLLCFPVGDYGVRNDEDVSATPVQGKSPPQFYTINRAPPGKMSSGQGSSSSGGRVDEPGSSANELVAALGAVSVSILVPVLAFLIVPGFIGRLVVSLLVGVGVVMALVNSQYTALPQARQAMMLVACYGTVMAILAGVVA